MADVPPPLKPLSLEDANGDKHVFMPQADITPLEAVLISQLFIRMVMTVWQGPVDWPTYVGEYKLTRHFVMLPRPTPLPVTGVRATGARAEYIPPRDGPMLARTSLYGEANAVEPARVEYVATRDIENDDGGGWRKGYRLVLLDGMPVPDGFEPVSANGGER